MPTGEHGLMPWVMLVDVHSEGQEVADDLCTVLSGAQTNTSGIVSPRKHMPMPPIPAESNSSHSLTTYMKRTRLAVPYHMAFVCEHSTNTVSRGIAGKNQGKMLSRYAMTPGIPCRTLSITCWKIPGADEIPNGR